MQCPIIHAKYETIIFLLGSEDQKAVWWRSWFYNPSNQHRFNFFFTVSLCSTSILRRWKHAGVLSFSLRDCFIKKLVGWRPLRSSATTLGSSIKAFLRIAEHPLAFFRLQYQSVGLGKGLPPYLSLYWDKLWNPTALHFDPSRYRILFLLYSLLSLSVSYFASKISSALNGRTSCFFSVHNGTDTLWVYTEK